MHRGRRRTVGYRNDTIFSLGKTEGEYQELVLASDSRLRSGYAWDCCPKIFYPERKDFAIAFAGDTMYAYPFIMQYLNLLELNLKTSTRAIDITRLVGHFLNVMNKMFQYRSDPPNSGKYEIPEFKLIFAGYSWEKEGFYIWNIRYEPSQNKFVKSTPPTLMGNKISVIGDGFNKVRHRIFQTMEKAGKKIGDGIDMEPFTVLRDVIRSNSSPHIGGPIQMAKVYKNLNVLPFGVFWPNKISGDIAIFGRTILKYEVINKLIIDPDSLEVYTMKTIDNGFQREADDGLSKS